MDKLREKIAFITFEKTTNDNGFPIAKEVIKYECRASKKDLNGKQFFDSMTNNSKIIVSFRVRYCNAIKEVMNMNKNEFKLKYNNKLYDVVYIYDIQNEHHYVDFKVQINE